MGQTLAGNDGDGATHSRCWLIYWQEIEPTFRRYQEAVGVDHEVKGKAGSHYEPVTLADDPGDTQPEICDMEEDEAMTLAA